MMLPSELGKPKKHVETKYGSSVFDERVPADNSNILGSRKKPVDRP